jgi:hypothetical protein
MSFISSRIVRGLSSFLLLAATLTIAQADTTNVCRVSAIEKTPDAGAVSSSQTDETKNWKNLTIKFKDNCARYESDDGLVTVYDYDKSRAFVLDNKKKTYYVKPGDSESLFATFVQITTDLNIAPQDKTVSGNVKKIAGGNAVKNSVDGTVNIAVPVAVGKSSPSPFTISGELWISDTLHLPVTNRFLLTPFIYQAAFGGLVLSNMGQKMVAQNVIAEIRRKTMAVGYLPLQSDIRIKNDQLNLHTSFETLSINSDTLSANQFILPDDYTRVDPPDSE